MLHNPNYNQITILFGEKYGTHPSGNNVELLLQSVCQLRKSLKKPCHTLYNCLHVNCFQKDQTNSNSLIVLQSEDTKIGVSNSDSM